MNNGVVIDNPTWFSHTTAFTMNNDGAQHVVTGLSTNPNESHLLYVGIEDEPSFGDYDLNDVIFTVDLGAGNAIQIDPVVFNLGVTIDNDLNNSALLSKAVVTFDLGTADQVTYDHAAWATVVRTGSVFTITGDANVTSYNALLDSFRILVGNSGTNEDYILVDRAVRTAVVEAWDNTNHALNTATAQFELDSLIKGSSTSDTLIGTTGSDTFAWSLNDTGTDVINNFNNNSVATGGDVLNLKDLLPGTGLNSASILDDYLDFSTNAGNTTIAVHPGGAAGPVTQQIVLTGVDLVTGMANDQAIIQDLLTKGKLITD